MAKNRVATASGPMEEEDIIEPGILTRLRPLAGWFLFANMIAGIAWGFLHSF
jgi:hypothetical protein